MAAGSTPRRGARPRLASHELTLQAVGEIA